MSATIVAAHFLERLQPSQAVSEQGACYQDWLRTSRVAELRAILFSTAQAQ